MSLAAQQSLESHYVMHTFGRSPVEFVEGHGMKLTGDDGREYLDFLAGIGVCSLGHGNAAVLSALEAQTKKLMHVSNYFYIEQRGQVAALLSKLANDDVDGGLKIHGIDLFYFSSTSNSRSMSPIFLA